MGHLTALWHTALEQQENGDLSGWTNPMIADFSDYPGDAPQFVKLLRKHGWLDSDMKLHDWWQYAGPYLRSKYKRNPEKWELVRNRYVTVTQPDTEPNRTDLTKPTKPTEPLDERTVDLSDELKRKTAEVAEKKARWKREADLLNITWRVKGEHYLRKVQEIPWEYCEWALGPDGLKGIGAEYREALKVRLDQKKAEAI